MRQIPFHYGLQKSTSSFAPAMAPALWGADAGDDVACSIASGGHVSARCAQDGLLAICSAIFSKQDSPCSMTMYAPECISPPITSHQDFSGLPQGH